MAQAFANAHQAAYRVIGFGESQNGLTALPDLMIEFVQPPSRILPEVQYVTGQSTEHRADARGSHLSRANSLLRDRQVSNHVSR